MHKPFLILVLLLVTLRANADCDSLSFKDTHGSPVNEYSSTANPGFAALLLPPTGGINFADRHLAQGLCQHGLTTLILDYAQTQLDPSDLQGHDRVSQETLQVVNDFIAARPELHWVVIGSSLGSLYASMAFGIGHGAASPELFPAFSRLDAAVLTCAGGSLPEILATSELPSVLAQRQARQKLFGFQTAAQYQTLLESVIRYDPLAMAVPGQNQNILMFGSSTDVAVPAATQVELWNAWERPERHLDFLNHELTIGFVYLFEVDRIFGFLQKRLGLTDASLSLDSDPWNESQN